MPYYSYLCEGCGNEQISETFARLGVPLATRCPVCGNLLRRAVCSVGIYRGMEMGFEPHFNNTVGEPVTSMRDFREKLKLKAIANTEATGIEHTYVTTDPRERDAYGITDEAVEMNEEANRKRRVDQRRMIEEAADTSAGAEDFPDLVGEKT